jgi:hypothetical protein
VRDAIVEASCFPPEKSFFPYDRHIRHGRNIRNSLPKAKNWNQDAIHSSQSAQFPSDEPFVGRAASPRPVDSVRAHVPESRGHTKMAGYVIERLNYIAAESGGSDLDCAGGP